MKTEADKYALGENYTRQVVKTKLETKLDMRRNVTTKLCFKKKVKKEDKAKAVLKSKTLVWKYKAVYKF